MRERRDTSGGSRVVRERSEARLEVVLGEGWDLRWELGDNRTSEREDGERQG